MQESKLEEMSVNFLSEVYGATPIDVLNRWGMERYSRFKTKCWKHLEESDSLRLFINRYFAMFSAPVTKLIAAYDAIKKNETEIFDYIRENLTILVGRMQRQLKQEKNEKESEVKDE